MGHVNGSGTGGVEGAARPEPGVIGGGDIRYANTPTVSQGDFDAPSFERVRELVQCAVDYVKIDTSYGPAVEAFRCEYWHLMSKVRDAEHRGYIKKRFKVLWAWLGRHDDRQHQHPDYSLIFRDELFKDGEARADLHHARNVVAAQPTAVETEPPPAPSSPHEDALSFDQLKLGVYLANLPADVLAEYMDAIAWLVELDGGAPVPVDEQPMPSPAASLDVVEAAPEVAEPSPRPLSPDAPIGVEERLPWPQADIEAARRIEIVEQPPEPAVEERAPALQHNFVGHTVTPEHRLIGLIVKHRVPAADVQLKPEHFYNADLQYTWKRWERLGSEVDQLDVDAIRARIDRSRWAMFAIWLIEVAGAPDQDDPIDPRDEIELLGEQIRGRTEEPPAPPPATDVVEILPPAPATAPPEIVEEITAAPPAVEEASPSPPAPSCSTSSGNGHSDFVGFDVSEPPSPPQTPGLEEQRSIPYVSSARMAEIEAANLAAMLGLAGAGIPTFPARLDWNAEARKWDKQPAIIGWKKAATTDPEIVRRWLRDLPRKLGLPAYRLVPGIWCGHPVLDLVVVDADRHGGADGVSAFDALVAEHGGLPVGPITATAGDGFHYIFKQPDGKPLGNHDGELHDQGINMRGHTGWVVAPGAVRPDGAMWRTADNVPSLVEAYRTGTIPTIPAWIVDLIRAPKPRKERTSKNKTEAKEAKPATDASSSRPSRSMDRRGKAWAEIVLKNGADELAAKPPHQRPQRKGERARLSNGNDDRARLDSP